jgi:hypothetical protein
MATGSESKMATRVQIINKANAPKTEDGWTLSFQWCLYVFDTGTSKSGYRFIWYRPDGTLQPARGQARLPSMSLIEELLAKAKIEGWGDLSA